MLSSAGATTSEPTPAELSAAGKNLLLSAARPYTALNAEQLEQFSQLYAALQRGNAVMNLTRLQSEEDVVLKHFADSLSLLQSGVWEPGQPLKVLDLGTGGGFPALPLAIARPELVITAADATAKKVAFVARTADELGLNVQGLTGRAEELARLPEHRAAYNVVVTRAVAALPILAELCLPFLQRGGTLLAMKADLQPEERRDGEAALAAVGGGTPQYLSFTLPESGDRRTLVTALKERPTPDRYPRHTGIPNKRPLKAST